MSENEDERSSADAAATSGDVARGDVTELLARILDAPPRSLPAGWATALRPGAKVGRYEIVRELGRGGFGAVYEALDRDLARRVAFKALHAGVPGDVERRRRLQSEAEAAARLNHPNIVTVHDVGLAADPPHLVMELLRGETLAERLRRGPQPLDEALRVAVEVARAMEHAHAAGVIHRDLKPSNVFLTSDGRVKVLDFGLARIGDRSASANGGTPAYMAPEQWREEAQDGRTDVFAAAAMLFEALSGRLPYRMVDGRSEVLEVRLPPPDLERVPAAVARLLRRALARDPRERPGGGLAWLEALLAVQRETTTSAAWSGTGRGVALATAAAIAVTAGAALVWRGSRDVRVREAAFLFRRAQSALLDEGAAAPERTDAVDRAASRAADLPERQRSLLGAWRTQLAGDIEGADALYARLLRADPTDREAAYLAGDLLFHQGRFGDAWPRLEVAAGGEAPAGWALDHLVLSLHELGRRGDLSRLAERLAGQPPTVAVLHALSIAWGSVGEREASLAAARRELQAGGGAAALDDLAASLFQAGDLPRAEALLRERLAFDDAGVLDARHALAVVLGAEGKRREGLALWNAGATGWNGDVAWHHILRAAFRAGDGDAAAVWADVEGLAWPKGNAAFDVALVLAYLGDEVHARRLASSLPPLERSACDAVLAARRGDPTAADRALDAVTADAAWSHGALAFIRAETALGAGKPQKAIDLLASDRRRYRRLPFGMLQAWMRPRGLYLEALARERVNDRGEARALVRQLLSSWRDADPGQRLLADARALQARLERAP